MIDTGYKVEYKGKTFHCTHGCPFDRGSADSYYNRRPYPHKGGVGGDSGPRIDTLTEAERADYLAGYAYNEEFGDKKCYD
jgi:hypothetical protein